MSHLKIIDNPHNHDEYNNIPVIYCADCLSLRILSTGEMDYCEKCGSTNTKEANIFDWEKIYEAKYKTKYLNSNGEEVRTKE